MKFLESVPKEYNAMLRYLKTLPEFKRNMAEKKLFLIKSYEAVARKEIRRMGVKFKKGASIEKFCDKQGVNPKTFCGYISQYEKEGIDGLIPHGWGHTKGSGDYDFFLPQIKELYQYGKVKPRNVFRQLREHCVELGIEYPSEATVYRMIKKSAFYKKKKKNPPKAPPRLGTYTPDTIKIVDKKAFNVAMYKYALVLPFLDPGLSSEDEKVLKKQACERTHYPFPGVTFNLKESTLNQYILLAKRKGVDGLIPKHCYRKTQKCKTGIKTTIFVRYDRPWESIKELEKIIKKLPPDFEWEKNETLDLLSKISGYSYRYMYKPIHLGFDISPEVLKELQALKKSTHRHVSNKAVGILMAYHQHSLKEISVTTNHAIKTIQAWFPKFRMKGIDFIMRKPDLKAKNKELRIRKNRIVSILHQSPNDFDINRTAWTLQSIADVYQKKYGDKISIKTVSRDIKKTDLYLEKSEKGFDKPRSKL